MPRLPLVLIASAPLALAACTTMDGGTPRTIAAATLSRVDGAPSGSARIATSGKVVRLTVSASGLDPGVHGIHLHTVGLCEGGGFASAGAHLNPAAHQHGTANPAGSHLGDLPNLVIGADGSGKLDTVLRGTPAELSAALFDADGAALVIHAAADDYRTDPSGNSGARIACGALRRR